ncbi:MAG: M23 family metallopeptidase [Acidobacteria bacterium]|nr:M23 family metallopeptidase [Acidobacteriota bacterium]
MAVARLFQILVLGFVVGVAEGVISAAANETKVKDAPREASVPLRIVATVSRDRLLPTDEFFLDMFMERYPADGGYRVRRFHGYEFFETTRERAVEQKRKKFEADLNDEYSDAGMSATLLPKIKQPLRGVRFKAGGYRSRPTKGFSGHKAYDMIVAEGTPVYPIGHGIVVAAESQWWEKVNQGEPIRITDRAWWATAPLEEKPVSLKSGNFVIVYHPPAPRSKTAGYYSFYAHMADGAALQPGQMVTLDDIIGHVEHSGYNAMRQGHGGHLHLSVMKDLGKGYLEPIKFGKYMGLREERVARKKHRTAAARRSARGAGVDNSR